MADSELMFPSAVQALLEQVRAQVDRLNNDVQASDATKVGTFRDNWHAFVDEFFAFYRMMSDSWIARAETANIDTLKDYQANQLPAWQHSLEQLGVTVTPGVVPRTTPTTPDVLGTIAGVVPWVVAGIALIVVGPTLVQLIARSVRK